MKFSARSQYAIEAMLALVQSQADQPLQVRAISKNYGIPVRFLEQIMAALKKAGLVKSVRGAHGGYVLGAAAAEIRVGQILQAVEGPIEESKTQMPPLSPATEVVSSLWREAQDAVRQLFESVTLEEMDRRKRALEGARTLMYHI